MPIPFTSLQSSAFWHEALCLSCGATEEFPFHPGTIIPTECPECGEIAQVDAAEFLAILPRENPEEG